MLPIANKFRIAGNESMAIAGVDDVIVVVWNVLPECASTTVSPIEIKIASYHGVRHFVIPLGLVIHLSLDMEPSANQTS